MTWAEGEDGLNPTYRERLGPPWWLWALAALFAMTVAVAYGFALGTPAGLVAGILLAGGAAAALATSTSVLTVDECVVRAGRARLPLNAVGAVTPLDRSASALARTREFDPRAYSMLRTWAAGGSVRIDVEDPRDPHPYWLVSSRHPDSFAAAIRAARPPALGSEQGPPEQAGQQRPAEEIP